MTDLWSPLKLANFTLPHRLAMAPMTRSRAKPDGTPGDLAAEYYAQRASLGLLISEGTQPSEDGQGYLATPGIYTDAHVAGWRKVADAVHAKGGRLFIQLMHVGRRSHPDNTPHHRQPVAPSAIAAGEDMFTMTGMLPVPEPRALETEEVRQTVADFAHAASGRSKPVPMASRSMVLTAIWSTSSWHPTPTGGPTSMAARWRTGRALPSKSPAPLPTPSARKRRQSASRPACRRAASQKARSMTISIAIWRLNSER